MSAWHRSGAAVHLTLCANRRVTPLQRFYHLVELGTLEPGVEDVQSSLTLFDNHFSELVARMDVLVTKIDSLTNVPLTWVHNMNATFDYGEANAELNIVKLATAYSDKERWLRSWAKVSVIHKNRA